MSGQGRSTFLYTTLRIVPRVERGEFINAGIVLFCRERRFLGARTSLDIGRLMALAPECDMDDISAQLNAVQRVASGDATAGPIAALQKAERFQWLASPTSTMIQRSEIHTGLTHDPASMLDHLYRTLVMTPGARLPRHGEWSRTARQSAIPELMGRTITRIRRLHYIFQDEANTTDGPIELTFDDGGVVMCDASADWSLAFYLSPWIDPLCEPLSETDQGYVDRYGRWCAFDVTEQAPYRLLAGALVVQVLSQLNDLLELTGLVIRTDVGVLDLQMWAGELRAFVRRV